MFVHFAVANENHSNPMQKCSFGGTRVSVFYLEIDSSMCFLDESSYDAFSSLKQKCCFSLEICGFCVLRCLVCGFYFACRFTLALCMFIFIFTSAEHWWLRAARGARASSRVAPRLLGRRLGPAGGCQGRPWPLPEGCQGRQRILVAAPGLLLGCLWVAFGPQGGGRVACGPLPGGRQGRQSTLLVAPGGCC